MVQQAHQHRRIDNFLISYYTRVPKSRIYQMLRRGEVRVNGGRVKAYYRLQTDDKLRLPPVIADKKELLKPASQARKAQILSNKVLYEDSAVYVFDKPAGWVVHGDSQQCYGVIEILNADRGGISAEVLGGQCALIHRLDKMTSGCLLVAKHMKALRQLNQAIKNGLIDKYYTALLCGKLGQRNKNVTVPLYTRQGNYGKTTSVSSEGKPSMSEFKRLERFEQATLVQAKLLTGRTHQLRVHASHIGHPVIGDPKYGSKELNRRFNQLGIRRMFLHASTLQFISPADGKKHKVVAPLPPELTQFLTRLQSVKQG